MSHFNSRPRGFGSLVVRVATSQPVKIDAVEIGKGDGLRLAKVAFVPGRGEGQGGRYGDPAFSSSPQAHAARLEMPGVELKRRPQVPASTPATASATWMPEPMTGYPDDWQIVVGLLPSKPDGGWVSEVLVKYSVGSKKFQLSGVTDVDLVRTEALCDTVRPSSP